MGDNIRHQTSSLRSKRLLWVSEQTKTREHDFRFWPREKWNESHFFAQSLTLVPRSLFQTTRKRLLRGLRLLQMESFLICYQTSQFCLFVVLFLSGCPRGQRPIEKWVASMLKKGQNDGRSPQRVSSPLQWGRLFPFAGSGRVISGLLVDRFRSRFGTNTSLTYCVELLAQYLSNTVIR